MLPLTIMFSYYWRVLLGILVAICFIVSVAYPVGKVLGYLGIVRGTLVYAVAKIVIGIFCLSVGLIGCMLPIRSILGKKYGDYALVLLKNGKPLKRIF